MNKLITIIIPVYNAEKYLHETIDSVLSQSYKNFEVILIDDSSNDCSWKIIEDYSLKDSRVLCYHNNSKGVSSARNYGLEKSHGKFIMFLDADDFLEKECLEKCIKILEEQDLEIIKFNYYKYYNRKKRNKNKFFFDKKFIIYRNEFFKQIYPIFLNNYCFNNVWGQLIKKDIIGNIKFDENLIMGEDLKFNLNLYAKAKKIGIVNEFYLNYRYTPTGTTNSLSYSIVLKRISDVVYSYFELYQIVEKDNILSQKLILKIYNRILIEIINNYKFLFLKNNKSINKYEIYQELKSNELLHILEKKIGTNNLFPTFNELNKICFKEAIIFRIKQNIKKKLGTGQQLI